MPGRSVVLACLLPIVAAAPFSSLAAAGSPIVRGRVVDEQGSPLPDALVVAAPSSARSQVARGLPFPISNPWLQLAVRSDGSGAFELTPPAEEWLLLVGADGRASRIVDAVPPGELGIHDVGSIELPEGRRLVGRILDRSGRPVVDARVRVAFEYVPGSTVAPVGQPSPATTGADGRYELRGIPSGGKLVVGVASHSHVGRWHEVESTEGFAEVDLTLETGGTIAGRLVTPSGEPVAGASIVAPRPDAERSGRLDPRVLSVLPARRARSNAEGRFELAGLSCEGGRLSIFVGDEEEPRIRPQLPALCSEAAPEPLLLTVPGRR